MPVANEKSSSRWPFWLASLLIFAGIVLTAVSALKLCSETCNQAHNYRLFGMPFEVGGAVFFGTLALLHIGSVNKPWLGAFVLPLLALGLGAEAYFIYLQKYVIGHWCPVCLSIAATILLLAICYIYIRIQQGVFMRNWLTNLSFLGLFALGVVTATAGLSQIDKLQAVEDRIKEEIKFGNKNSPVEVYVFTDWACPACRAIEPALERMGPKITAKAQLVFVDTVVHPETLNFAPYNISFMVNAKSKYFDVREALTKLSISNKKPTDQDIARVVAPLKVTYKELPYEDVTVAMRYFEDLVERFKVTATPTVAIVNRTAKKGKKLSGADEITEANVLKAIDALK
ncbi:MAG: vitamin K epoxide reductase family protein [Parachlamydiaceae bacterium]